MSRRRVSCEVSGKSSKFQAPTSNRGARCQVKNSKLTKLQGLHTRQLVFGAWSFSGAWMLMLGAFSPMELGAWNLEFFCYSSAKPSPMNTLGPYWKLCFLVLSLEFTGLTVRAQNVNASATFAVSQDWGAGANVTLWITNNGASSITNN